jgi:hypothetical protein
MDATLVLGAWMLVWIAGIVLVVAWRGGKNPDASSAPGTGSWLAGVGFLAGAFAITLWMRLLSLVGVPFSAVSVLLPSVAVIAAAVFTARHHGHHAMPAAQRALSALTGAGLAPPWRLAWCGLLLWLALRFAFLWVNVVEQPLYPWDAWIQWATKARVWFELRRIVPFVDVPQWLAATGSVYTDAAPGYPATVSLWQVYSCTILGHWDDALMNVPWWFVALALALLVYGYLRGTGFVRVAALAGATVVATLPLINVHVALAGYADLPMAAYYCAAALATLRWTQSRSRFDAGLAVVLAAACPFIKTPGIVWLLTLAAPLIVALVPHHGKRVALACGVAAVMVLLVLAQTSPTILNYHLHLDFAPPWEALFDSLFMLASWNLLWYGVIGAALLGWRQLLSRDLAPFTLLIAAGLLFLFIVFAFTNARAWVETQTTVNRAVLHLAPLLAVWMMVVFHRRFEVSSAVVAPASDGTTAVDRAAAVAAPGFDTPAASDAPA